MADAYAEGMASSKLNAAKDARRFAHFMRRGGQYGYFREWMRKAIRDWREFKYYRRRASQ